MTVRTAAAYTERADENGAKLTQLVNGCVEEIYPTFSDLIRSEDKSYIRERFF